jgi:hypothetical protein
VIVWKRRFDIDYTQRQETREASSIVEPDEVGERLLGTGLAGSGFLPKPVIEQVAEGFVDLEYWLAEMQSAGASDN